MKAAILLSYFAVVILIKGRNSIDHCRACVQWMFLLVPRPVPLEHYIFPAGGDGLHLVVDNKGRFRENNFQVMCRL